jgi:hypothetical protein
MKVAFVPNAELALKSVEELREEVKRLLGVTAENLVKLAAVVHELESRGEDISQLRLSILPSLRAIAGGKMLPEVVVKYAGRPTLLKHIEAIPIAQQKNLLERETVFVVTTDDKNNFSEEEVRLAFLNQNQIRQVFSEDSLRSPAEQRAFIRSKSHKKVEKQEVKPQRFYTPRADKEAKGIWVGKMFVTREDVIKALSDISGNLKELDADTAETITVRVTKEEKAKLKHSEKLRKLPEWFIIRESLQALGLI